jgi:hypothetical protein
MQFFFLRPGLHEEHRTADMLTPRELWKYRILCKGGQLKRQCIEKESSNVHIQWGANFYERILSGLTYKKHWYRLYPLKAWFYLHFEAER